MSTSTEYVKKHNRNVCSFTGCRRNKSRCPTLRFFSFPVNRPNICDLWVQNCANESLETVPKKTLNNKVVCEKHFEKDCFSSPILKHRLHASAIPTILPLQDDEPDPTPTLNEEMNVDVTPENSVEIPQPQTNELPDAADHSREALFSSPRSTNSSIPDYKTLQSIKGHAENLEEEKQETLAMRYKSPASYEQMRSDGFALPSTSTMPARWLQAVDLRPGACIEIMKIVRNELHHMADGKKDAVILFDEMSIKTSLDYDSKKDMIEGAMAEKINERLQIPISQEEKIHRLKKYENIEDVLKQNLKCTVCCADLSGNIITRNSCKLHSHLKVLVCKKCKAFYADGNFSTDEDGGPKYCRWCGDGGHMFLCDKCNNGFCKPCVRRNFSRNYFQKVNTGDRWSCFMCSPEVLYDLRATAWAARELCRKRQEEENRNGKYHRRKKYSSLEESFTFIRGQDNLNATLDETRPDQNRNTIEKNPDLREVKVKISHPNPNTKSRKGFYKNPVLLQAREEMKKFFSQLVKLHENDRFLEMKNEILSDNDCEDFLYIEKLELMVQDFIICFIEELNRFSNDLSSRLTQLQRMYMIEEDLARRNGGFEGGDQEHDSDQENIIEKCDGMQSKQDNLVEDDAISLSMSVSSEISCFSSVSNSRHNTDVVEGRLNAENVFDSDDSSSRTDFSLANIGSTSTPSKGKEKLNEVINNMDAICEEDEEQEEEEERLKGDDDEEVVKTLLKLLDDDDDIDGDEEDDRGEEEEDEGEKEDDLAEKEGGYASIEKGGVVEEEKRGEILRGGGGEEEGTAVSQEDGGENGGEEGDDDDDDEDKKNRNEKRINFFPNSSSDGESENMEDDKTHASNCEKASIKDGGDKVEDEDDRDWEDIKRLTNLGALERKRKHSSSESGDDNEPRKTTKEKSITKKPKKSEDKYDILENLTDKEGNEDSNNTDEDDDFCIKNFGKSFKKSEPSGFDSKLWLSDYAENSENHSSSTEGGSEKEGTCKMEDEGKKESKKENRTTDSSDSEVKTKRPRKRASWRSDSLLTGKLSSSDEEYKITVDKKKERKKKRKTKSIWVGSESESEIDDEECETQPDSSSDSSIQFVLSKSKRSTKMCSSSGSVHSISSMSENDDLVSRKKSIKWKRKKRTKIHLDFSSDSSENGSSCEEVPNTLNTSSQSQDMSGKGRRNIRKVMKDDDVTEATRRAIKEEEERKQRVLDRQQKYNDSFGLSEGSTPIVGDRLVLDFDTNSKKELICVDENLVSQMKPHQVQGVKFMWDACFESVEAIKDGEGGGCILAHCMGLGKTFQVVSLVHTLLMHRKETKVRRVLICCPLSTVLNWCSEFQKWLSKLSFSKKIAVHHLANDKTMNKRVSRLKNWHNEGGVMIMGYEMFRSLTNEDKKVKRNYKTIFTETLLEPGADLVICDEGHTLKNLKTSLSQQMNKIQTRRRIVLTGTPLQNNLIEYHCMMNFVKPNYLGTRKEFVNRFVNPITNGQFADSTEQDFRVMKRRAHVLHKMLDGITQRRDYRELMPYLPPKQEYVISIRLTELQISLMKTFLEKVVVTKQLFKDYQSLNRLWSHPLTLKYSMDRSRKKPENDGKVVDIFNAFNDHTNDSDIEFIPNFENEVTVETTEKKEEDKTKEKENADKEEEEWWKKLVSEEQMSDVTVSSKLVLLFAFLKQCEAIGDKMLIFSQSLPSLDVIEFFLNKMVQQINSDKENVQQNSSISHWKKDVDYFRLDGSTSSENREKWTRAFNKPTNRARLFLISTKAGGLGINLTAANRVILFDASWNPSNDIQSIFRVFRFGQDKPCYIYRFIAQGTMEEKIYERQISKLSLAIRVVDEQQVNRYYSQTDLQELYKFTPADPNDRPIPIVPKDRLLCDMLEEHSDLIYKVFMHDSLLDHVEEEELDEEEQRAAWEDYKNEKKNLDRVQASSLLKVPAHDVEMMEKILIKKYAHIPPETLKEVIAKQVEAWKRSRAAQLTGGALVSGPSTNAPSTSAASAATTSAVSAANVETISLLE